MITGWVKRMARVLLVVLWCCLLVATVTAQDGGTPPPDSLDALPPGATPLPLPTRMPQPAPSSRAQSEGAQLEIYFSTLAQGNTGLVRVTGDNISGVRARFIDQLIDFFPMENDGYYALLSVNLEQQPRRYPLDVFVSFTDGTRSPINTEIEVVGGPFIAQEVTLPQDKADLLNPDVERNELARLESIFANVTLERYWGPDGFQMPILSTLTSPFGAFRTFNGTLNTRHTGWDIRTTLGIPILASEAGVVAFAGHMDIRGNVVIVDHGYGVYSTYSHMSQVHVTRGQSITKGQILGITGNTGRTTGPHFHWEMAVNGEWVDSVQFLQMWMP